MRISILVLAVLSLVLATSSPASVVVDLGGAPGIVAQSHDEVILDYLGHVWGYDTDHYVRMEQYDPPVPVSEIRFWTQFGFVTKTNEVWDWRGGFQNCGTWPGLPASIGEESGLLSSARVSPNPATSSCRVFFPVPAAGWVVVQLVDASGRAIRQLLQGQHPAGDYSLVWDGRDDEGRELPGGVYFTRIVTAEGVSTGRVVLTR